MKHTRFFSIILLLSVFIMNTGVFCKSLCLTGHHNMGDNTAINAKSDICPSHEADHSHAPKELIKCSCPTEYEASLGNELTISSSTSDLIPNAYLVSVLKAYKTVSIRAEIIPSERPPQLLA
jgi:hypothetical protein